MASVFQAEGETVVNWTIIALSVNVIGNFIDAIGWCMQKKAHISRLASEHKNESFVQDCKWWAGFAVHVFGDVLSKISYAFGPASLLLPLDTLRIAFTTALAAKYLNETVSRKEILGIVIIIGAAIISTMFGPRPIDTFYTIKDIEYRYGRIEFLIVAGLLTLIAVIDYILLKISYLPSIHKYECFQENKFYMLSYVYIAAFCGAWNVLLVKIILEIIASSFESTDIAKLNWSHWLTYINIIALPITSVMIEYWRQKALLQFHTGYVVAMYTVLQIIGGILLSSGFFEEFKQMEIYALVLFFVGIILSFIGVVLVTYDDEHHQKVNLQKTMRKLKHLENKKGDELDVVPTEEDDRNDGMVTVDDSSSDENKNDNVRIITENEQLMEK